MNLPYTGVGSRVTPEEALFWAKEIARELASAGYLLRSGGAEGADTYFERGAGRGPKQIFRPARGFTPTVPVQGLIERYPAGLWLEASQIAQRGHPNWRMCNVAARQLHTRNVFQVLGPDLRSLSKFLLCWTENGSDGSAERPLSRRDGGTATAIRLAAVHKVPVLNMRFLKSYREVHDWVMREVAKHAEAA